MEKSRRKYLPMLVLGFILIAKAYLLPISLPPNSTLAPRVWGFWDKTYIEQVSHWKRQNEAFRARPEESQRTTLQDAAVENLKIAWILLIGSTVLGILLVVISVIGLRRAKESPRQN